ncbi:hypothetical protein GF325_13740 [Candidatus Bathyarchaeota archaeon]|nr:hypothetical protein [Candidatus Bathyarchaeota archaeon]
MHLETLNDKDLRIIGILITVTIEIDDAGTGDPLLGAAIGFYRRETDELHFEWIPIEAYQEGTYRKGLPQEEAAKAVMRGLLALNIKEDETVMICQGSIFDRARDSLDKANIKHEPLKVEGVLQDAVEEEYIQAVEALGIKSKHLRVSEDNKDKEYRKRYFLLLNWAKRKAKEREKFVKNGLNFWKYAKGQRRQIPGGWKQARRKFEDKLMSILKKSKDTLTWGELKHKLKSNFPKRDVWVNHKLSSFGPTRHNGNNTTFMRVQVYNYLLGQVYFFLGERFPESAGELVWKALILKEEEYSVNGVIIYVKRDKYYKDNMKWLAFLRGKVKKLLGGHIRFVTHVY